LELSFFFWSFTILLINFYHTMKYFILLLFGLLVVSCSDTNLDLQEQATYPNNIAISKIEAMKTMDEASQKIAFNFLNSDEKHYFRLKIMDEFINENVLNSQQIELINELKANFTSNVYEKSGEAAYFKNIYADQWIERSLAHFTEIEIYELSMAYFKSLDDKAANRIRTCKCHVGSIITCRKKTTASFSNSDGGNIEIEYGTCSNQYACSYPVDDSGNYDTTGCGFLGLWLCNGNCD